MVISPTCSSKQKDSSKHSQYLLCVHLSIGSIVDMHSKALYCVEEEFLRLNPVHQLHLALNTERWQEPRRNPL